MEEKSVQLPEGAVYYLESGSGPTLVFFHGAIATPYAYLRLLQLLAKHYHVIAPIHPGHGKSFPIPGDWDVYSFVRLYHRFFASIHITPQIVIGHSFGGTVALLLAATGVGRQIVVMDAPCLPFALSPKAYIDALLKEGALLLDNRPDMNRLKEIMTAAGMLAETVLRHPEDVQAVFREGPKLNITKALEHISAPVSIFWGQEDQLVPVVVARTVVHRIAHARLFVFSGRGHSYPVTDPEFTCEKILSCCRKTA